MHDDRMDPNLVALLVEAGRADDVATALREKIPPHVQETQGHIMVLHWTTWDRITRRMNAEDLWALVRALTVAEHSLRWSGGSVPAASWTFREYQRRFPERADALADWCLANTRNRHVPFTSNNFGARSLDEYHRRYSQDLERQARSQEQRASEEERAKARREQRTPNLFDAVQRGDYDAVKALLDRGADASARRDGLTLLEVARKYGKDGIAAMLESRASGTESAEHPA